MNRFLSQSIWPYLFVGAVIGIQLITQNAFAQNLSLVNPRTREAIDQFPRERTKMGIDNPAYIEKKNDQVSDWDLIQKNLHGSYFVSLMGPRLLGNSNETYNIFLADVAPVQLFHSFTLSYKVNADLQIGINQTGVQNLYNNVVGLTGLRYDQTTTWFDPSINFGMPNLFKTENWSIFTSFSFSLAITSASQEIGRITTLEWNQSFSAIHEKPSPWSYGFNYSLRPQFYTEPKPSNYPDRQVLTASVGHQLGYRVSPVFALNTTSTFDVEHRAPDPQGASHFGSNLEDRARISCSITPQLERGMISLGGYFQFLVFKPQPETSIIGADFSIGF